MPPYNNDNISFGFSFKTSFAEKIVTTASTRESIPAEPSTIGSVTWQSTVSRASASAFTSNCWMNACMSSAAAGNSWVLISSFLAFYVYILSYICSFQIRLKSAFFSEIQTAYFSYSSTLVQCRIFHTIFLKSCCTVDTGTAFSTWLLATFIAAPGQFIRHFQL